MSIRGAAAASVAAAAVALLTGCGGGSHPVPAAFTWVHSPAPASWRAAAVSKDASIPSPPGWRSIQSDPGTVSVSAPGRNGDLRGYLNLTPQQGGESTSGWARFRVDHNREEGDRDLRIVASAEHLPFRTGSGSCVIDDYRTSRHAFRELACIVDGSHDTMVAVGAAPPAMWPRVAPVLERAIAGVRT